MNATYLEPSVKLDSATRRVRAEFVVRNSSRETWRAGEGFGVGYHLFDAETGTLIVDGARVIPERDVKPGESTRITLDFELPPEDGRYHVVLSPVREEVCWYYEQGWPFLLVEGATREGAARVDRVRVATSRTLRREQALRAVGRAFTYPLTTIWRNRSLIRVMVRRDILGRYRGSFGGAFWTIINPLLLMLTYFFVFGIVLRTPFGKDNSRSGFALYFLAGMLPWLAFSEAVGRAPGVMMEHRNFVKKLVFAVETLPVNLVVSGLVSELFAVALFCLFLWAVRGGVPPSALWLPVLLAPQLLFTAGLSWFLAALGVFVRDLGQIMGFVLTVWFFITPICYPEASLPHWAGAVLTKNPIYVLVAGYRSIFLEARAPAFGPLWKLWLVSVVVFVLGHAWFYKLRKSFADII
ncbi:MAG TPA: ABC transporter permease [Bryobacteraceae bacterium]|nr:ABC transporter permease [Bryobacteraceae bacterium]